MKRYFYVVLALLLLAGCSEQPSVENLVKSNLRDSDSAKFRNFIVSKHKTMACIDWNAKNSVGGYGEWNTARLANEGRDWSIIKMQISTKDYEYWCPQKKMDLHEATQEIVKDLLSEVDNAEITGSTVDSEVAKEKPLDTAEPKKAVEDAAAAAQAAVDEAVEAVANMK